MQETLDLLAVFGLLLAEETFQQTVILLGLRGIQCMIIFCLAAVIYHKGDDVVFQAFLKQDQPSGSSVSVLERVDSLIICMELCQSVQIMFVCCIVFVQKCRHARVNIFRRQGAG